MKQLAVSNIAWDTTEDSEALETLRSYGVRYIEVAPTKFWADWHGADVDSAEKFRQKFASEGFAVPSFQAIFFGKTDIKIFRSEADRKNAIEHIRLVASLARQLGAQNLVFGSPGTRDRGDLTERAAFRIGVEFFGEASRLCATHNVCLCLEPNPTDYQCNFVNRYCEAATLIRAVDHPGFRLILDTACLHLAGDDPAVAISQCVNILAHFHVSEPFLADFSSPVIDHISVANALTSCGYKGVLTIEMRRSDQPLKSLAEAVQRVSNWYF